MKQQTLLVGIGALLAALVLQAVLFVSRQSPTWDECDHLYAGYRSWTDGDFGLNPEHPPLAKMVAAVPLLSMPLEVPALEKREFKHEAFLGGRDFLFGNDADRVLFRARLAALSFTLLLAVLTFLFARELWGNAPALFALALVVFDPNILAHGALVTTDMALSCFMLATTYAFYRYVKAPSPLRLAVVGLALGLAFASKHSAVLLAPMLVLLALVEVLRQARGARRPTLVRLAVALVAIGAIAVTVLWGAYGFRYTARPGERALNPPLADALRNVPKPHQARILGTIAGASLLPESYLYGLADVLVMEAYYTSYVFGRPYAHGVWFYFPVAYLVKSSLVFLVIPLLVLFVIARRWLPGREVYFLTIPPAVHFLVAMSSRMNIGVRHILPVYAFLAILGAGALWALIRRSARWKYGAAGLLLLHVASSVRAFPAYIAYSNELWGGPTQTYKYLTDSNSDWGQQLKSLKTYLDGRGIKECWFAYFADGTVDLGHYGIPCRMLPTLGGSWLGQKYDPPPAIDGPIVMSAGILSGFEFGPGPLNPYRQFQTLTPTAQIDGGVFVFDGRFEIPLASAVAKTQRAEEHLGAKQIDEALALTEAAVALAPEAVRVLAVRGDALTAAGRPSEARPLYEKALQLAQTVEPEFQAFWVGILQGKLAPQ